MSLSTFAEYERFQLQMYKIKLPPRQNLLTLPGIEDKHAVSFMRKFQPHMLTTFTPREIYGDGNCGFRAVSLGLYGTEEFHSLLRLFTVLELLLNRSHYEPLDSNFMTNLGLYEGDTYADLIYTACTDGSSINMAHLYALSAAIMLPLKTFYPPLNENDEHSRRYTRLIIGRTVSRSCNESDVITLMWSQKRLPKSMKSFRPNHFVLLCRKLGEHLVGNVICNDNITSVSIIQ